MQPCDATPAPTPHPHHPAATQSTDAELGTLLEALKGDAATLADPVASAVVRDASKAYTRTTAIPKELAQRIAKLESDAYAVGGAQQGQRLVHGQVLCVVRLSSSMHSLNVGCVCVRSGGPPATWQWP